MRLSNLVPAIPANIVASLDAIGVRTEIDLLFSGSTFEIYNRLPANTLTLRELTEYTALAAELCAAPGTTAQEALRLEKEALTGDDELRSGLEELDELLRGLGSGKVIEISGDKGSGKTTLALNIILHHLASQPTPGTAVWVDTTGDFSSEKALNILACRQLDENILERVQVVLAFDIDFAQALLEDLSSRHDRGLRFLVIDTITPLLGPLFSAVSAQGHAIMTDFMRQLQAFARKLGVTVFVINNTSGHGLEDNKRKPALGPSFVLLTDTSLWLQAILDTSAETDDPILHSLQIVKSRSKPTGCSMTFCVRDSTVSPVLVENNPRS
ncbi:P-loop containing nucleoside triphosphate hydrolase protein [Agrocybe pediades]|nr:P-loop containing nucleoside triphosphate hydrolase protein [Agrocybe pediades]